MLLGGLEFLLLAPVVLFLSGIANETDPYIIAKARALRKQSAPAANIKQGSFSNSAKRTLAVRRDEFTASAPAPPIGEATGREAPAYMRHRLRNCLPFWKTFCQSLLVLKWIEFGFDIYWISGPPPTCFYDNHRAAYDNADFVTASIMDAVLRGVMEPRSYKPHLVMPLGVAFKKSNGKPRLIYDAKFLNSHILAPSFKYEDLGYCHSFLQPGDYMITTDYSSGYHHIDLHPDVLDYFGCFWQGQYYVYTSLPFGLSSACWAFTKISRALLNKWRRAGHRCSGFIDDNIYGGRYYELIHFISSTLLPDTRASGFILNMLKSVLIPSTIVQHLGMLIDTVRRRFEVPKSKRDSVICLLKSALAQSHRFPARSLEVLAGNLASMHWAFGPLTRLMTLSFYADISSAPSPFACISLSNSSIEDIQFWLSGFDFYNGFNPIWQPVGFQFTIYTDAAGRNLKNLGGWAGWAYLDGYKIIARGIWMGEIIFDHSTTQELAAVFNTLQSFNRDGRLIGLRILVKTDNQAVFFIINRAGSRDSHTHALCKELLWYCIHNTISLHATWIPRELNAFADFYSKLTDSSDWRLDPLVFLHLNSQWGPFHIDLFASFENHHTPAYYSYFATPTCTGVDAFNFTWGRSCWCFPPFSLMGRILEHARACSARMCLICPFTPTALWWPLLTPNGQTFFSFVRGCELLPKRPNLLTSGRLAHTFLNRKPRWNFLALLIDFPSLPGVAGPVIPHLV